MALIDEVTIKVQSGAGGNGCISFRREKYVPRGGPNGGTGGRGGDVKLVATRDKTSLLDFKFRPKFEADRGQHGMGSDCFGRGGEDLVVPVPLGTIVYDATTGDPLVDLVTDGAEFLVAKGGKGGRGNMSFASSTNRAPRIAEPGEPGEAKEIKLELRVLADVGLVGLPNAGKSSFLRTVSNATPKIADYPFTTLEPHLGVVGHKSRSFVIADLPGLIEGASDGTGLGHKFLRHVARNRLLLHLVDVQDDVETIAKNIEVITQELTAYDEKLLERERLVVFTKTDTLSAEALEAKKAEIAAHGLSGYFISSHSGAGVGELLDTLAVKSLDWRDRFLDETAPSQEEAPTGLAS